MKHYFTGKPCKRGHVALRYVSTRSCVECSKEHTTNWHANNPERTREIGRKTMRAQYQRIPNLFAERNGMWKKANAGWINAYVGKRRASVLKRTPSWASLSSIQAIYEKAAKLREAGNDVHVDHEVPLQGRLVSGLHVHNNLKIVSASYNHQKSNHFLVT